MPSFPEPGSTEDRQPLPNNFTQDNSDLGGYGGTAPKKASLHARCMGELVRVKGEIMGKIDP